MPVLPVPLVLARCALGRLDAAQSGEPQTQVAYLAGLRGLRRYGPALVPAPAE